MSLTKRLGVTFVLIAAVAAIAVGSVKAASVSVRVGVYDDTERRPMPEKAEIWIRGLGSWWIVRETVKERARTAGRSSGYYLRLSRWPLW